MRRLLLGPGLMALFLGACSRNPDAELARAREGISADTLARHIQILASDAFQGRLPGTIGEERTVRYLEEAFRRLGLEPGNPNGTYVQEVPLVSIATDPASARVRFERGGRSLELRYADEVVINTRRPIDSVRVQGAEVVFVGYGVNAPEVGWNDYKTDVRGKVVLVLINDPDYETGDTTRFRGRAMTYYGRWTYKFEEASRQARRPASSSTRTGRPDTRGPRCATPGPVRSSTSTPPMATPSACPWRGG